MRMEMNGVGDEIKMEFEVLVKKGWFGFNEEVEDELERRREYEIE